MRRGVFAGLAVLSALACPGPSPARAASIAFETVDLPDTVPGQDLWRYNYFVSGFPFQADQGFSIFFDRTLYGSLEDPPPSVNPDWSALVLQPDTMLLEDGVYDTLARTNGASLANAFSLSFIYLGAGAPGSQPFSINQFDALGNLTGVLERGNTIPRAPQPGGVPEPASMTLLLSGLAALAGSRFVKKRRSRSPIAPRTSPDLL